MAENNWLLNDSAPVSLSQESASAVAEAAWGWFGLPYGGEGSAFAAAQPEGTFRGFDVPLYLCRDLMSFEGPRSGGTFADDAGVGTVAWATPGNAIASDDVRTTAALTAGGTVISHFLKITNFGFTTIPDAAIVTGIEVVIEASATSTSGSPEIIDCRPVKAGVIGTTDLSPIAASLTTSDVSYTQGSPTNTGGETLLGSDVKSSGFGVAIAFRKTGAKTSTTVRIDHVTIKVYYGVLFDAASNGGYTAGAFGDSWAHVNAGNYLVVGVAMLAVANVTGVTFNNVAMTLLGSRTSAGSLLRIEIWGLAAPSIGSFTIAVNLDSSIAFVGMASSWKGVHQTVPVEGFNSATAQNVGAADATVDVTTVADNCFVVDVMATSDGSVTVGAGQTSRNNVTGAAGSGTLSSEGPKTPAGAVTMSWTDVGVAATWVIGGVALRPAEATVAAGLLFRSIFNRQAVRRASLC